MAKVAVVGQHSQSFDLAKQLASQGDSVQIFTSENCFAFDETLLAQYIAGEVKEKELYFTEKGEHKNIEWVLDNPVSRINFKKKKIYTSNKQQFEFDQVLIADSPAVKFPDIKGTRKEGVFHLKRLEQAKAIISFLTFVETAVVEISDISTLLLALSLAKKQKEVIAIINSNRILSDRFDEDVTNVLKQLLEAKNIRLIAEQNIVEVIGEHQVKAVKLASGKIFATEMVVLNTVVPDLKFVAEQALQCEQYILANDGKTNLEDVFACDWVAKDSVKKTQDIHVVLDDFTLIAKGAVGVNGQSEFMRFDSQDNQLKKISLNDQGILTGYVLINANAQLDKFDQAFKQQISLNDFEEKFLEDQFSLDDLTQSCAN